MLRIVSGAFIVLHGLVHLFYFGQSQRLFELQPEMVWPDGAWAFSRLLGDETTRLLAGIACVLAAVGFVVGGMGILVQQGWWRAAIVGSAAFSSVLFVLFWDGKQRMLTENGAIGLLINVAILATVLVLQWPSFGF